MKFKLIAVLIAVAALFIGAVLWRTDSFVYGDRMNWVEAQTRTQMGSLSHALNAELKSLQRLVLDLKTEDLGKTSAKWNTLNPYFAVASFGINNNQLQQNFFSAREGSAAEKWSPEFVKAAVGNLGNSARSEYKYFVKPFQDSQRNNYLALLFIEQGKALAIFGSAENFQSLIDSQKGSISSFSVATVSGLTVAHSVPEYVGTSMSQDVVFQEAIKSGAAYGSSVLEIKKDQKVYGVYEVVPQTNLFVLSAAPLDQAMKGREGLWMQFLLLGLGIIAVGAAGALWVIMPAEKRIEDLEQEVAEASSKVTNFGSQQTSEPVKVEDPGVANKVKLEAATQVSSALAHEMRGPLASILGYTQMIVARSEDEQIIKNTDSILREARAARSVIEKLLGYAGEEIREKTTIGIEAPLSKTLKDMQSLFESKGVNVVCDFSSKELTAVDVESVSKAFSNILQNSVEAMERMQNKEIKIRTYDDEAGIHLTITDSGEGIESQNLNKIFDPFYTTRSFQNHMGLGLSAAYGVLKEHNAEVSVESQRGQGTTLSALFKLNPAQERIASLPTPPPAPKAKKIPPPPVPVVAPVEDMDDVDNFNVQLPTVLKAKEVGSEVKLPPPPPPEVEELVMPIKDQETVIGIEVKSNVASGSDEKGPSPLDMNIENLLEELPEATAEDKIQESPIVEKVIKKVKMKVKKPIDEDELTFIDGFLDNEQEVEVEVEVEQEVVVSVNSNKSDVDQAFENQVSVGEKNSFTDLATSSAPMNTDFISDVKILPPTKKRDKKNSKLDDYKVDIRKPGKRV